MPPRYPRLCAAAILIVCVIWPFSLQVEAKGRKGKPSASRSQGKSRKQISSSRSRSSRRRVAKRGQKGRQHVSTRFAESNYAVVPDRIEVLEYGSSSPADLARSLNPPDPRYQLLQGSSEPDATTTSRRRNVNIESSRALQIQQALANRGFYSGELTGVYDEATVDAMRRFQASEKISVTGYPTAPALKRLGLANW